MSKERIKLAIDAMGGDYAPKEIVEGVNLAIQNNPSLELVLFGDEAQIKEYLVPNERVSIVHASDKLDMGEKDPIRAIRTNKELSLVKAFEAVKNKECLGAVTCGPTQGVVVAAHMIVKKIEGMGRIALCPIMPEFGGKSRLLLDVGANVELRAEHIVQIAHFAATYLNMSQGIKNPIVGLVNIGSEPGKGRAVDKEAYEALKNDPSINFYGNIEPKEMFESECDVLVTDGYCGNLVLKTLEGTAKAVGEELKIAIRSSFWSKIGYALFMRKAFNKFKKKVSGDDVGGALLFGVDGVIVKSHGSSNAYTFSKAIERCASGVKGNYVEAMKARLKEEQAQLEQATQENN